jgi:hypothetical protein
MEAITVIHILAQKYPQKWFWSEIRKMLVYRDMRGQACNPDFYSTEECDAILAEHGLVMWVVQVETVHKGGWMKMWRGTVYNKDEYVAGTLQDESTKREATELTFLAALEYILKEKS